MSYLFLGPFLRESCNISVMGRPVSGTTVLIGILCTVQYSSVTMVGLGYLGTCVTLCLPWPADQAVISCCSIPGFQRNKSSSWLQRRFMSAKQQRLPDSKSVVGLFLLRSCLCCAFWSWCLAQSTWHMLVLGGHEQIAGGTDAPHLVGGRACG
jgi:hypothetical protein